MVDHYRTIVISDLHLGSRGCKYKLLNNFLKHNSSDYLYLNGDVIDAWKIQQNRWYWPPGHGAVIKKILKTSRRSKIMYVVGNHDDFLRNLLPFGVNFGNIIVCNQCDHVGADGKKYLVVHGDLFDGITRLHRWLSFLGDKAYDLMLQVNVFWNFIRRICGLKYWSLSNFLKKKVKGAVNFVYGFEKNLAGYAKSKHYDGVICGHIHVPEIKTIDSIIYMNSGDWVESCTALVETMDGEWKIIHWNAIIEPIVVAVDDLVIKNTGP
jgi:UDP-2,3-diacylglucosamine pyrophosphatase LpxH